MWRERWDICMGGLARFAAKYRNRPILAGADMTTLAMGFIATVTAGTGLDYLLPGDTFRLSPSFTFMARHGGEDFWGVVIWTLGAFGLYATYLEWWRTNLERAGLVAVPPPLQPDRRIGRYVWQSIALLWIFVGASFAVTVPTSPGAVNYVCLGIFAQIVAVVARHRREAGAIPQANPDGGEGD